jgi:hypothetical protein
LTKEAAAHALSACCDWRDMSGYLPTELSPCAVRPFPAWESTVPRGLLSGRPALACHRNRRNEGSLTRHRFRNGSRFGRLAAGVTATLSAVFLVGALFTSPALAADEGNSLTNIGGHTCERVVDDGAQDLVLCADLGLYITSSGEQFVTLQIQLICQNDTGGYVQCNSGDVEGTVANGGGYTDWTDMRCLFYCQEGRNYFYPFGGLPISLGNCDQNVWGAIEQGSGGQLPDETLGFTSKNFGTPHYTVCENSPGTLTYS